MFGSMVKISIHDLFFVYSIRFRPIFALESINFFLRCV